MDRRSLQPHVGPGDLAQGCVMTSPGTTVPLSRPERAGQAVPTLTTAQIARVARHGRVRSVVSGDILFDVGQTVVPFFVMVKGHVEIERPATTGDTLVIVHGPGEF